MIAITTESSTNVKPPDFRRDLLISKPLSKRSNPISDCIPAASLCGGRFAKEGAFLKHIPKHELLAIPEF